MFLTPYVLYMHMGFNTHTYTHKTRQNLTATSTRRLVYWLLLHTSGKKSNAILTQSSAQYPKKPLLPSAKPYYFFFYLTFFLNIFHCNGYLCLKLLYYNYENQDFLGSFCSQYRNLQVSNLIIYDSCVPVGLGFGFFFDVLFCL